MRLNWLKELKMTLGVDFTLQLSGFTGSEILNQHAPRVGLNQQAGEHRQEVALRGASKCELIPCPILVNLTCFLLRTARFNQLLLLPLLPAARCPLGP